MKLYTKTGDNGQTSLIGGTRVPKNDVRIEAYGTLDELNSNIGLLISELNNNSEHILFLRDLQRKLFDAGALLATDTQKFDTQKDLSKIDAKYIQSVEYEIDRLNEKVEPLKSFVLPSGAKSAAICHICRTIARRSERKIYEMHHFYPVDKQIFIFINRLSDYFFILARNLNKENEVQEFFLN